jgi:ArsR family transcriptional regulator
MNLVSVYQGLADENRLRIVHLLLRGPLGVKHLQGILGISQVRVSKHLAYLRERGIVEVDRNRNWMFYRLPADQAPELKAHLKCLQECAQLNPVFEADLGARQSIQNEVERIAGQPGRADLVGEASSAKAAPSSPGVGWGPSAESDYVD